VGFRAPNNEVVVLGPRISGTLSPRVKLALTVAHCFQAADRVDRLSAKLSQLEFQYSDPTKNFDRSKVKGLVANLITVKDPKAMTALEVTAGGKLCVICLPPLTLLCAYAYATAHTSTHRYQVVVDSADTGKLLLSKGRLKRRVTIIPIDKVKARSVRPDAISAAKREVGAENAQVALSYVGYDAEVETAMK
jgi:structural maintenance of chromosome 2